MDLYYRFDFAAARRLPALAETHPCARLHGHTFHVELVLRGEPAADTGWMIDFHELGELISPIVSRLDHHYLNDIEGLDNPTTELIAVWLWDQIKAVLPALVIVEVSEHGSCGIRYFGPDDS